MSHEVAAPKQDISSFLQIVERDLAAYAEKPGILLRGIDEIEERLQLTQTDGTASEEIITKAHELMARAAKMAYDASGKALNSVLEDIKTGSRHLSNDKRAIKDYFENLTAASRTLERFGDKNTNLEFNAEALRATFNELKQNDEKVQKEADLMRLKTNVKKMLEEIEDSMGSLDEDNENKSVIVEKIESLRTLLTGDDEEGIQKAEKELGVIAIKEGVYHDFYA